MVYNKYVLDSMKDLSYIIIKADDCEVLYYNQAALKRTPSLLNGKTCSEVFNTKCDECFLQTMRNENRNSAVFYDSPFGSAVNITLNETMWENQIPAYVISINDHYVFPREAQEIFGMPTVRFSIDEIYPRMFGLNFTENSFNEIRYHKLSSKQEIKMSGAYDELIEYYANLMHPEFKDRFLEKFSYDAIVAALKSGITVIDDDMYQIGNEGEYHWTNFHIFVSEDYTPENMTCVALCMPIDTYKQQEFSVARAEVMAQKAILENIEIQQLNDKLRMAENRSKRHNDVLQNLYETVTTGIVQLCIEDLTYITINKACIEIYGYTREEFEKIENPTFDMFVFKDDLEKVLGALGSLKKVGDILDYERRIMTPSGNITWIKGKMQRVVDINGNEIYQLVCNDITNDKQNELRRENERELYRIAALNSADIIFEYETANDTLTITENRIDISTGKTNQFTVIDYSNSYLLKNTIHEDDRENAIRIFCKGDFSSPEIRISNTYLDEAENHFSWYSAQGTVIKRNGVNVRIVGTLRDIEHLKHTEEETVKLQQMFNFVIDNDYDHFCIINVENRDFSFYSASGKDYSRKPDGSTYKEWCEYLASSFVFADDRDEYLKKVDFDYILENLSGSKTSYSFTHRSVRDNEMRWKENRVNYYDDKKHILVVTRDIHQAFVEEEKKRRILSDALESAEAANNAKRSFLSHMSHDIRTPMNAIIGMTAIAEKMNMDNENTKVKDCLDKIDTSAHYLLELINNILDVSKIESGKLMLQKNNFIISEFIETINVMALPIAKEKNIQFSITAEDGLRPSYYGDKVRLNQIVTNLISNAIKFTNDGGRVSVVFSVARCMGNHDVVQIVIKDNGIGIDNKYLERIFEPFEQAVTSKVNSSGTGLGLAITKSLVTLMDGNITVNSKLNEGTSFIVTVPLEATGEDMDVLAVENTVVDNDYKLRTHNGRIMIVEDNELNMEIACTLLRMEGYDVITAENGLDAVKLFNESEPFSIRIILMDIRMPVMDGLTATRCIRKLERPDVADLPIYAMSANAFTEDIQLSIASGMNGHLSKPINITEVLNIVGEAATD